MCSGTTVTDTLYIICPESVKDGGCVKSCSGRSVTDTLFREPLSDLYLE